MAGIAGRVTPAPGLPSVIDLSLVPEGRGPVVGRPGFDQVLLLGEQIVVGPDHRCAQGAQRQVGKHGEVGQPRGCVAGHRWSVPPVATSTVVRCTS
ncbi:Uncharacterised protein [Mycobacteroides abscessus subsp. abscessus]|nr:Uncharacterised protein [Mycobacteroides abscessus subsp. abscessus]